MTTWRRKVVIAGQRVSCCAQDVCPSYQSLLSTTCRGHTTVINADEKIRLLMAERGSIYTHVTELTNRIKQQALAA